MLSGWRVAAHFYAYYRGHFCPAVLATIICNLYFLLQVHCSSGSCSKFRPVPHAFYFVLVILFDGRFRLDILVEGMDLFRRGAHEGWHHAVRERFDGLYTMFFHSFSPKTVRKITWRSFGQVHFSGCSICFQNILLPRVEGWPHRDDFGTFIFPVGQYPIRAVEQLQANYDIRVIQNLLGHSSLKTTMIYTHCVPGKGAEEPAGFLRSRLKGGKGGRFADDRRLTERLYNGAAQAVGLLTGNASPRRWPCRPGPGWRPPRWRPRSRRTCPWIAPPWRLRGCFQPQ